MTVWTPQDDGFADLSSHDTFVNGAPHNTFARLRREDPLSWTDWDGGEGFWNVVRHADITELNRNYELMSSAPPRDPDGGPDIRGISGPPDLSGNRSS